MIYRLRASQERDFARIALPNKTLAYVHGMASLARRKVGGDTLGNVCDSNPLPPGEGARRAGEGRAPQRFRDQPSPHPSPAPAGEGDRLFSLRCATALLESPTSKNLEVRACAPPVSPRTPRRACLVLAALPRSESKGANTHSALPQGLPPCAPSASASPTIPLPSSKAGATHLIPILPGRPGTQLDE